jgi:hypothetical protein
LNREFESTLKVSAGERRAQPSCSPAMPQACGWIPFPVVVPLKVKKQILKVIVYDAATDRTGSRLIRMK